MNTLIHLVAEAGLSQILYYFFHAASFFVWIFFSLSYRKHYGITKIQSMIIPLFVWVLGYLSVVALCKVERLLCLETPLSIVRGFVFFPIFAMIPAKKMKIPTRSVTDFIAPGVPLYQSVAHFGCCFAGCCHGYPSSWGIWNSVTNQTLFPIQIVEIIIAFLIFLGVFYYAKKKNFQCEGKAYPLMLILFGFTRFLCEFLRDNYKVFGNISNIALHAAFMFIVGVVWLWYIKDKEARAAMRKKHRH